MAHMLSTSLMTGPASGNRDRSRAALTSRSASLWSVKVVSCLCNHQATLASQTDCPNRKLRDGVHHTGLPQYTAQGWDTYNNRQFIRASPQHSIQDSIESWGYLTQIITGSKFASIYYPGLVYLQLQIKSSQVCFNRNFTVWEPTFQKKQV